jgi:hypothetical protein
MLFLWERPVSHVIPVALKHVVLWLLLCFSQSGIKLLPGREKYSCTGTELVMLSRVLQIFTIEIERD